MKKPSLREVTRMVRETHEAWSHPIAGSSPAWLGYSTEYRTWSIITHEDVASGFYQPYSDHSEWIDVDGLEKFDAVAIARRLIAGLP